MTCVLLSSSTLVSSQKTQYVILHKDESKEYEEKEEEKAKVKGTYSRKREQLSTVKSITDRKTGRHYSRHYSSR